MNSFPERCAAVFLLCASAAVASAAPAHAAGDCPAEIAQADQLVLVLAESMNARSASVRYFERVEGKSWKPDGKAKPAMLGKSGLGWSWAHEAFAGKGEPVKKEGDGRTPAGFFMLGGAFGSDARNIPNYATLDASQHYCVDDPASPHYNTVLSRAKAGKGVSGEDMARIGLYRQGLFLNYPTSARRKGGSCIFVHVWRASDKPTVGCVALADANVKDMQRLSAKAPTLMAILPMRAWEKLRGCFPGILNPS